MTPVGTSPCRVMPAASYLNGLASSPITVLPENLSPLFPLKNLINKGFIHKFNHLIFIAVAQSCTFLCFFEQICLQIVCK